MDFTRKGRLVKDGHRTPDPETSSYAVVVSHEYICVRLIYAALHHVPLYATDIRNAYSFLAVWVYQEEAPSSHPHSRR